MRLITIPNRSSVASPFQASDVNDAKKTSSRYDRLVDAMEETGRVRQRDMLRAGLSLEFVRVDEAGRSGAAGAVVAGATCAGNLDPPQAFANDRLPFDGRS